MSIKTCLSTHLKSPSLLTKFDKLVEGGMEETLAAREVILDGHKAIYDRANTLKSILKMPTENYVRPTIDPAKIEAINKSAEEKLAAVKSESAVKKEGVEKKVAEVKEKKEKNKPKAGSVGVEGDVESTTNVFNETQKSNPTVWQKIKDAFYNVVGKVHEGFKNTQDFIDNAINGDTQFSELAKALKDKLGDIKTSFVDDLRNKEGKLAYGKHNKDGITVSRKSPHPLQTWFHEAVHKLTVDKLYDYEEGNLHKLSDKDIEAIQNLHRIFGNVQKILNDKGIETKQHNPFKNVREFVAEALTNPEFQEILNKFKGEGKSPTLLKQFLDAVSKLLGLKDGSILDDVFHHTENLFNEGKSEQKNIAEAYHDAKSKGIENDFTKAVEQSIKEQLAEKKEKPKIKPKAKDGKLSVGDQITYGGSTWTVTSIGKNRVSVTNGSVKTSYDRAVVESMISGNDGVTKPTLKPKKRFSEKDISDVVDHYGVSESAAVEILDAISGTKNKNALAKKIEQIISGDQQTSIKAPLKGGEAMTDAELTSVTPSQNIIQATTDFEGKPHTALANSSAVPFNQAQADLKNDGRVQFDSGVEDIGGLDTQSLFDIMTGDNTGNQRGIAAAYIAAHRMIGDKNSPLVALFSKVGKKIRIINSNIFNVYNQKGKFIKKFDSRQEAEAFKQENPGFRVDYPPIMAAQEDGTLVLNAHMLNERLEEFWGEKRFLNWMEMALYEEAIHLTQIQTATEIEMNQIFAEMTSEEKELVADKYGVQVSDLSKYQMASEYVRMIVQNNLFGTTTEMLKPKRAARNYLSKILDRLVEYFGGKKDRITDQVVARIEETVRGARNESLPKIKSVEKLVSEKPRISLLEDGVDGPIYKVQYKNYQFAVGQGMSRAGQVFYEVEKIKGEWVPKELLGSNPSEALVALKYRVDQNRAFGTSIGESGAASMDRYPGEAGIRLQNLQVAKQMREAGIGEIAVKLATGWELGGDGKWRYEIADDQMKFSASNFFLGGPGSAFKLPDMLKHPDLYKAYPFLNDVIVEVIGNSGGGLQGYITTSNDIGLAINAAQPASTLIHEIQHLIQRDEGFAKGGNTSTYYKTLGDSEIFNVAYLNMSALISERNDLNDRGNFYNNLQKSINVLSEKDKSWSQSVIIELDNLSSLVSKRQDIYHSININKKEFFGKPEGWSVNDHPDMIKNAEQINKSKSDIISILSEVGPEFNNDIVDLMMSNRKYEKVPLSKIFSPSLNDIISEISANDSRIEMYEIAIRNKDKSYAATLVAEDDFNAHKIYERLAGETEARNASVRMNLSANERRESLLADTEDVAEADKIYLMPEIGNTQVEKNQLRTSQSDNFDDEFLNKKYEEFHGKEEAPTGADPIADYVLERGKDIISEVGYTHLKRMAKEADKGDVPDLMDYEVPSMKLAQAEWDLGEIVSKVFTDYEFGSALDYFVDKIKDTSVLTPVRMILARKLIEKFEGRPDIARFIRVKLDLPLGNEAGRALLARRDWGTKNTGNPRDNKTAPAAPASGLNTRGLWGRDLSEEQENLITATVPGSDKIIQAKAALEDAQDNSVDSEIEETLGMMLDQSEERVAELEAEIEELRSSAKSEAKIKEVKEQLNVAKASADKLSKEFSAAKSDAAMARLQKRWKSKNPVKELKDLINKIAKSCSA